MLFNNKIKKAIIYYNNLNRNYKFYITTKDINNPTTVDSIDKNKVSFGSKSIDLSKVKTVVVSYPNGEILDAYGKIEYLPDEVFDIEDTNIKENTILLYSDVDFTDKYLNINHLPNKEHPKNSYYITQIQNNFTKPLKVKYFGGYFAKGKELYINTVTSSLYSHEQFNNWFNVETTGWILPGETVSDPNNYGGPGGYWIYFCEDIDGEDYIIGKFN